MILISQEAPAGTPVPAPHLFEAAWDEFIELQVMDRKSWVGNSLAALSTYDRYDIGLFDVDRIIGGLTLSEDFDVHVGRCMAVTSNYVLPEYRHATVGMRCFRECIRVAKSKGYDVLAYTHRLCDWQYKTIYRRLT